MKVIFHARSGSNRAKHLGGESFPNLKPHSILVVDDDPAILKMLERVLSREGHIVDTASNGKDGIERIYSKDYDLVITDIKMPVLSRKDFATIVNKIKCDKVTVIGMSGAPWSLDCLVFNGVSPKPFFREDLLKLLI